jgi:hypothetical protein
MTHATSSTTRRTVLTTIATGSLAVAGCADSGSTDSPDAGAISRVDVAGTELVVEYDSDTSATGLAMIAPSGEAFADRQLTPGASRETISIGTAYPPGTYTVQLVEEESVVAAVEQSLRPDIVIRELKLAQNHPDEMYEGAAGFTITTEVIVTVENIGQGPEKLIGLHFDGYIPRPTPDELEESGIAAVNQPVTYTEPVISPGDTTNIYSITFPFAPGGDVVSCTPEGTNGQFTVTLIGNVAGELTEREYNVTYQGQDLTDCQISVERVES